MSLVRLIKICRNENYSRVSVGKHMYEMLYILGGMKQDAFSPIFVNFAVEYAISRDQINQDGLKLNGSKQLLVYAYDVNVWGRSMHTIKTITESK